MWNFEIYTVQFCVIYAYICVCVCLCLGGRPLMNQIWRTQSWRDWRRVYKKASLAFSAYTRHTNANDQMCLIFLCSELPIGLLYFCVKHLAAEYSSTAFRHEGSHSGGYEDLSSGILRRAELYLITTSCWFLAWHNLRPWTWMRYIQPKHRFDFQRATGHYIPQDNTLLLFCLTYFNHCTSTALLIILLPAMTWWMVKLLDLLES
jgi:hypothetical protein